MYLQCLYIIYYVYISIRSSLSACLSVCLSAFLAGCLSVCLCASQPVMSVCLSYLSYLSYLSHPYLPDSSVLCALSVLFALSVFYSYLYIVSIYTMPRFLPIVSIVLLSHQHLPNSSIYLSIDRSPYLHGLSNPIQSYASYLSHHAMYISGIYTSHAYSSVGQKVVAQQPDFIFQTSNTRCIVPLDPTRSPLAPS